MQPDSVRLRNPFFLEPMTMLNQPRQSITRGIVVETRSLAPTNHKGPRISAICRRDSECTYRAIVDYRQALDDEDNHRAAVQSVLGKIDCEWLGGVVDDWVTNHPLRIVGSGSGGRNDSGYFYLCNRGEL